MRLDSYGPGHFEALEPHEPLALAEHPGEFAEPATTPPLDGPSQTLSEMAQQALGWVNTPPPTAPTGAHTPGVTSDPAGNPGEPTLPEPPDIGHDIEADRSADAAFVARHDAWTERTLRPTQRDESDLANALDNARLQLGRIDTFHHGISEGFLDYASEMAFDLTSAEVHRLEL